MSGPAHCKNDLLGLSGSNVFVIKPDVARWPSRLQLAMATSGSLPERQEFSGREVKPPCRFQDRASAPLMTDEGWSAAILPKAHPAATRRQSGQVSFGQLRFLAPFPLAGGVGGGNGHFGIGERMSALVHPTATGAISYSLLRA
jgi:hypothetical protein